MSKDRPRVPREREETVCSNGQWARDNRISRVSNTGCALRTCVPVLIMQGCPYSPDGVRVTTTSKGGKKGGPVVHPARHQGGGSEYVTARSQRSKKAVRSDAVPDHDVRTLTYIRRGDSVQATTRS